MVLWEGVTGGAGVMQAVREGVPEGVGGGGCNLREWELTRWGGWVCVYDVPSGEGR